eukprot:symbB.v1.2.020803.t1/scaffold1768.1/size102365/4
MPFCCCLPFHASKSQGGAVSYVMKMVRRKWMRTDPNCIAQRSDGLALTTGDCGACSALLRRSGPRRFTVKPLRSHRRWPKLESYESLILAPPG